MRGDRAVDDVPEVRADLVRAALFAGMAGLAFLEHGSARLGIGGGQQVGDRLGFGRQGQPPPPSAGSVASMAKPGFSGAGEANSASETRPTEKTTKQVPSNPASSLLTSLESIRPLLPFPADRPSTPSVGIADPPRRAGQIGRKLGLLLRRCNTYKGASSETFCHFSHPSFRTPRSLDVHAHPDPGPHGLDAPAGQAAGRHRRRADDRACRPPRRRGRARPGGGGDRHAKRGGSGARARFRGGDDARSTTNPAPTASSRR